MTEINTNTNTNPTGLTENEMEARFAALEAQRNNKRARLVQTEHRLRAVWGIGAVTALVLIWASGHSRAVAQGYGITLAQAAARIAALETKTASLSTLIDPNTNQSTVRFTGVNVQIVDGTGATEGTQSGLGNLIVGYNELREADDSRMGNHNVIVGIYHNYSDNGGAVLGYQNAISNAEACVTGGALNTASGSQASVSGGRNNTASGSYASVSGGANNVASGFYAAVSGGYNNHADGAYNSIGGGVSNQSSSNTTRSCISGGSSNAIIDQNDNSAITGGYGSTAGSARFYGTLISIVGGFSVSQNNLEGFSAGGTGAGAYHSP